MTASERRLAANPDSYGATHALERLAVATQDAEAVVSLLGGDLSSVCQYLRVAEAMVEMGRDEDALEWARRGLEGGGTARALLRRADRRNYEEAMPWLRRMRDSGAACGRRSDVEEFVEDLRTVHRNRPTFVRILNAARL